MYECNCCVVAENSLRTVWGVTLYISDTDMAPTFGHHIILCARVCGRGSSGMRVEGYKMTWYHRSDDVPGTIATPLKFLSHPLEFDHTPKILTTPPGILTTPPGILTAIPFNTTTHSNGTLDLPIFFTSFLVLYEITGE